MSLVHLTLNTGNLVYVAPSDSLRRLMADLAPVVEAGEGPLPGDDIWHLYVMPLGDGAAMLQIADEPGLSKRPIIMGIAAWRQQIAEEGWRMVLQGYLPLEAALRQVRLWRDPPDRPDLPWLAVWLLPDIITADRETLLSLGRIEQAVALLLSKIP